MRVSLIVESVWYAYCMNFGHICIIHNIVILLQQNPQLLWFKIPFSNSDLKGEWGVIYCQCFVSLKTLHHCKLLSALWRLLGCWDWLDFSTHYSLYAAEIWVWCPLRNRYGCMSTYVKCTSQRLMSRTSPESITAMYGHTIGLSP